MKKIIIICPYFGKLPKKQLELWVKTCSYNPHVDFVVITDDNTKFILPKNVKIIRESFDNLKKKFQKKFNFEISLETPYKLCDFKPCYGYLFDDLVKGYDYWGHNDMSDSIFGNLEGLMNNILKNNPDKVGYLGHLTLYKNNDKINKMFFKKTKSGVELKDILGVPEIKVFDESFGPYSINTIFKENGLKIISFDDKISDIGVKKYSFRLYKRGKELGLWIPLNKYYIIEWDNGKLFKIYLFNDEIIKEELIYTHYQKRKINYLIDIENTKHFLLVPNKFIPCKNVSKFLIRKYTFNRLIRWSYIKKNYKVALAKRLKIYNFGEKK